MGFIIVEHADSLDAKLLEYADSLAAEHLELVAARKFVELMAAQVDAHPFAKEKDLGAEPAVSGS